MRRILLVLICTTFVLHQSFAQDTTKVLFIGNSFTSSNNLPNLFSQLAFGAGHPVVIASHMPGGVSVGDIALGTAAHMNNPTVYALIKSNDWDYLVLQDNQGRFAYQYGQFPNPTTQSRVIEGHIKIRDSLLRYHPCAHLVLFGGFGTKNGLPPSFGSGISMIDSIYQNYNFLNDSMKEVIAPIGPAFRRVITGHPAINLWGGDNTHPSLHGSFLASCVVFSTIFKQSPMLSTFNPSISAADGVLLKDIAYQTTTDSLSSTGLQDISPVLNRVNNTLSISNYQSCSWFYNNAPFSSTNCTITMSQPGRYTAVVTDANGCTFRAFEHMYMPTDVKDYNTRQDLVFAFPNPTKDVVKLKVDALSGFLDYILTSLDGKVVFQERRLATKELELDLSNQPAGVYMLQIKIDQFTVNRKIVKCRF